MVKLALALLLAAPVLSAGTAAALTVTDLGAAVQLSSPEITVTVQKSPVAVSASDGAGTFLAEAPAGSAGALSYFRGASQYHVVQATDFSRTGDRVDFTCTTDEGPAATVSVEF